MNYFEFCFEHLDDQQREILIAQLSSIHFEGFEENDHQLKAFIKESEFSEDLFNNLIEVNDIKYSKLIVKEKNWNEAWESDFMPVSVMLPGATPVFAYIRADFHSPLPSALHDIIITPKMSFGTGHHATTFQMMEEMSSIDFLNKVVIDFGTGTGLLSILAEKLGAKSIVAIDYDDWSINNAKENIENNNCTNIQLIKNDTCIINSGMADVILANINLNVILDNLISIKNCAANNAIVVFSGILVDDFPIISEKLTENAFNIIKTSNKDNWLVMITKL